MKQDYLKSILWYDPDTGIFVWIKSRGNARVGYQAGVIDKTNNYVVIRIDSKNYRAHRLAWVYMTGEWPVDEIDHRDLNKNNNKWCNLREAFRGENSRNIKLTKANSSGKKGVYWNKAAKMWLAQIRINGKKTSIGYFDSLDDAGKAYVDAALKYHKEFANW